MIALTIKTMVRGTLLLLCVSGIGFAASMVLGQTTTVPAASTLKTVSPQRSATPAARATGSGQHAVPGPTWSRDLAPLLYANCTGCHHPGGAGPFSLLTYADARRWAAQVSTATKSRYMPPWLPEPGYGDFADSRRLTAQELQVIQRWVAGGMAKGAPGDAPPVPDYSSTWTSGKPDLVLTVAEPFTVAAGGEDVFRNFILPYGLEQTHYVRAMEVLPGAAQIVHHANVLIDRTAAYRREHPMEWRKGLPGMELVVDAGKSFDPDGHFLFWKPDTPALIEPEGMPWRLDPGNDLILNMHLKPSGKSEIVQARIGLYFTDRPPVQQPMLLQLDRDDALTIPAGEAKFTVEDELTLPIDVQMLGIYPHAHYLGKDMQAWATLPGGRKEWLIWIRDWDIDRQSVYSYRKPLRLPRGTVLHMRFVYDNSGENPHNPHSPPVPVRAGNRSEDEMAHLWIQVLPVQAKSDTGRDPRLQLEEAWMRNRLRRTPRDYVSLYNLGAALTEDGKPGEAAETFRTILGVHPGDARTLNALGSAMEGAGGWQEARRSYAEAIVSEPGDCDARFNLASVEQKHELPVDAEKTFREFLTVCPDDAAVRDGLGAALLTEERYDEAQVQFLRGLALLPAMETEVNLHQHLAFTYVQTGRADDALAQLREAVRLAPGDGGGHALLAQVLAQTDHLPEAIAEQKTALHLNAEDRNGWNNLGVFEARAGDGEAARADFEQVLRLDPQNAQARANLAHLPRAARQ